MRAACGIVLAIVCLAGCDPTPVLFKAVAIGAPIVSGAYGELDAADAIAQDKVREMAKVDKAAAKEALDAHLKRYDVAAKVLKTTSMAMQTALDSVPLLKAAHDKQATLSLVADLLKLYEDVRAAMGVLGVTIPRVVL